MNEVLSQDEIDQLLQAISSGDTEDADFKPVNDTRKIKIYDFKRPDKFLVSQLVYRGHMNVNQRTKLC